MVNICEWELENQLQFASIVVNGLVAAGTIAAVVVAICANKQTKKALCQSKNIELLDKRIDILEKIKNDEDVSENIVNLMFSEHEKELFQIMTENKRKKNQANDREDTYFKLLLEKQNDFNFDDDIYQRILNYQQQLSNNDVSYRTEAQYRELCHNYNMVMSETGDKFDLVEIEKMYKQASDKFTIHKNLLIQSMKGFIEKSIQI